MIIFYTVIGDTVKIYLDLVLFINFAFDLILLLSVAYLLKRKVSFYRVILASFIGSLSVLFLFFPINNLILFLLKILISIVMIIITFKYQNIKYTLYNLGYLYLSSIVLGGGLYLINDMLAYDHKGLVFITNGMSLNFLVLIIISPIIIALYCRQLHRIYNHYDHYFPVEIYFKHVYLKGTGYLDSGNTLLYKRKPVILMDRSKIPFNIDSYELLPYQAVNITGLLKCILIDKVKIGDKEYKNIYLGLLDHDLNIDGVDILLNQKLWEG